MRTMPKRVARRSMSLRRPARPRTSGASTTRARFPSPCTQSGPQSLWTPSGRRGSRPHPPTPCSCIRRKSLPRRRGRKLISSRRIGRPWRSLRGKRTKAAPSCQCRVLWESAESSAGAVPVLCFSLVLVPVRQRCSSAYLYICIGAIATASAPLQHPTRVVNSLFIYLQLLDICSLDISKPSAEW